MLLSKVAAAATLGVALFPCECDSHPALVPYVHGASAAVMFLILTFFCRAFYKRAMQKGYPQAKVRAAIYVACGMAILLAIVALAFDHFSGGALSARIARFVFYGESAGVIAFGVSWLTASRTIPVITRKEERFSPLREENPA
jgi:O-antigen/teichoic acid export membrane protein